MRPVIAVRTALRLGAVASLMWVAVSAAQAASPQPVSAVVDALQAGDAFSAAAALDAYSQDLPADGDGQLHTRLSRLRESETFRQLGPQGQAMLLYLHAATAPDPKERLALLRGAMNPCKNAFVRPFIHYEIGRLLQSRGDFPAAGTELATAVRMGAMWQQTLALRACSRLETLASEHPQLVPVYEEAKADLSRRPVEAPEGTAAGSWSLLYGQGELEALAPEGQGEPQALRVTARIDPQDPHTLVRLRLTLHRPQWGSRLSMLLRPSIAVPVRLCVIDADTTAASRQVEPAQLAPGQWRQVSVDLSTSPNSGPGDFILDEVALVEITVEPSALVGFVRDWTAFTLDVADLTLAGDAATVLANAPAGDPRQRAVGAVTIPDTGDSSHWTASPPAEVAEEATQVHSAPRAARITVPLGTAVGHVGVVCPDDRVWQGDAVSFWCLSPEGSALTVLAIGEGGSTVSRTFATPDLSPGAWSQLTVPLEGATNVGVGDDTMEELLVVYFVPETRGDGAEPGTTCNWYIDDVRVTGEGPAKLRPRQRAELPPGSIGLDGQWSGREGLGVSEETQVTRGDGHAVRLSGMLGPETNAGAVATFFVAQTARKPAAGLRFWCYPRDVPFLPLIIWDTHQHGAFVMLEAPQLKVGEWSEVTLLFEGLDTYAGDGGPLSDVSAVYWVPDASWDREGKYITQEREYVWYIDDMELLETIPAAADAGP